MRLADCTIVDPSDPWFRFVRTLLVEKIHRPTVTSGGRNRRALAQSATRAVMHTEVCSSLNDVVYTFGSSPAYRRILDSSHSDRDRLLSLDALASSISERLIAIYTVQAGVLDRLAEGRPRASDFLNLYTAALINAVRTFVALGRVACEKIAESGIAPGKEREAEGGDLIFHNRHVAGELSRFSQPLFNLFLNMNGCIPGQPEPYQFPSSNYACARLGTSHYLLPTRAFLESFAEAANSTSTVVENYDRAGLLEKERFRHAYDAEARGCPAFKWGLTSTGAPGRPGVGQSLLDSMDQMICEIVLAHDHPADRS